jgi:hypothetical protein
MNHSHDCILQGTETCDWFTDDEISWAKPFAQWNLSCHAVLVKWAELKLISKENNVLELLVALLI